MPRPATANSTSKVKTFSVAEATEPIEFEIGDDSFVARSPEAIPANVLIKYSELVGEGKLHEAHRYFFGRALVGESADLFNHRLDSLDNPINLGTMIQVAEWLVEAYSTFPTQQPRR